MVNSESDVEVKNALRSRGVPSKFSFYLPAHYSREIRAFQSDDERPTRNLWDLKEVLNFVFPEKYQPTYHSIAFLFLELLSENLVLTGEETANFLRKNSISKATFYNRVLPKLKRVGMIKVEREAVETGSSKHARMRITLSKTFGNYLNKIADSWLAIVDDARTKKRE